MAHQVIDDEAVIPGASLNLYGLIGPEIYGRTTRVIESHNQHLVGQVLLQASPPWFARLPPLPCDSTTKRNLPPATEPSLQGLNLQRRCYQRKLVCAGGVAVAGTGEIGKELSTSRGVLSKGCMSPHNLFLKHASADWRVRQPYLPPTSLSNRVCIQQGNWARKCRTTCLEFHLAIPLSNCGVESSVIVCVLRTGGNHKHLSMAQLISNV